MESRAGERPRSLLVTGATGFVGSHLVLYLLQNTADNLYCVVRAHHGVDSRARLIRKLETAAERVSDDERFSGLPASHLARVYVVEGDIRNLESVQRGSCPEIDELWHNAADISFAQHHRRRVFACNVDGTRNMLELARRLNVRVFNHVSTSYVAGTRVGVIPESPSDESCRPHNPYEESKRIAERDVMEAAASTGIDYRIFRVACVIGHSSKRNADPSSTFYGYLTNLFRLKARIEGRMPDYFQHNELRVLGSDGASVNLVPVDYVVEAMASVASRPESVNRVFHVVNPTPTYIDRLTHSCGVALGIPLFPAHSRAQLNAIDTLLFEETDVFNSYFEGHKEFASDNLAAFSSAPTSHLKLSEADEVEIVRSCFDLYQQGTLARREAERAVPSQLRSHVLSAPGYADLTYFAGEQRPETLVILNAYGQSLAFWEQFVAAMKVPFQVVTWQMRGTASQRGGVEQPHDVGVHAADIERILDAQRIERCHILGWCTGPKVALEFYRRQPQRVSSMTFLTGCFKDASPALAHLYTEYERYMQQLCSIVAARPEAAQSIAELLKDLIVKTRDKSQFGSSDFNGLVSDVLELVPEDIKPLVVEPMLTATAVRSYATQLLALWKHDATEVLRQVRVPTLFVGGERDNIAAAALSKEVSLTTPGSVYLEVKGGSHYMHYDQPELVSEIVREFVSSPRTFEFEHGLVSMHRGPLPLPAKTELDSRAAC